MKTNELKIEDLVKCGGRVVKITALGSSVCCISDIRSTFESRIGCDDLTPIPITEKILEKNGWKKNLYTEGMYHKDPFIFKQYGKRWGFVVYDDLCIISSVHQLQHLLWALGIDNNLKL